MQRRDEHRLLDMLDAARQVEELSPTKSRAEFDGDPRVHLSVVYLIQTIGEAAGHVSEETRASLPAIDWHKIVGMRNRLVHDYRNIDLDFVWATVQTDIPALIAVLEPIVPPPPPDESPA